MARTEPTPERTAVSHADAEPSENLERRTRPSGGSVRPKGRKEKMNGLEEILKQFDQHDDSNADYILEHWNAAVSVYDNGGSMLDLDNIVRLERLFGKEIDYKTYREIDQTVGNLEEWMETALQVQEIVSDPMVPLDDWENVIVIS